MDLLIPTGHDLAGWACVILAVLALTGVGRLFGGGAARLEVALVAGWGAAALVLTLWGVATQASLRGPGYALIVLGLAALRLPRLGLRGPEWRSLGRVAVLAVPLLAVMASARPSGPDTFLNILPNAAYLWDHASFPGVGRAIDHSYFPAAPYNLQIAGFIAGLVDPSFPANALIAFNLVLQLAVGLLLARLIAGVEDDVGAVPSWGATALGMLLATALNPGFDPRFDLAGYGEAGVTVTFGVSLWLTARVIGQAGGAEMRLLALALAALVGIKQDGVVLVAALLVPAALLALAGPSKGRTIAALSVAAVPAALLYLAWHWYAAAQLPGGEWAVMPRNQWQFDAVPLVLGSMLHTMAQKILFYAVLAGAIVAAVWRARRGMRDVGTCVGLLLGGAFALYSAALVWVYIAVFPREMGSEAHSYFRYSSHLGLALMVAIVLLARERAAALVARWRHAGMLPIAAMVASPLLFLAYLRFDLEPPALRVWLLAEKAAPLLDGHARVALLLPGDNGSVATMLETVLRTIPPRHPDLDLTAIATPGGQALDELAAEGFSVALVSCVPPGLDVSAPGTAALIVRDQYGWHAEAVWSYPPAPKMRWSHQLAEAPLCL
jgi:hypothetical protein